MPLGTRELEQVLEVVQAVGQAQTRDEFVSFTLGGVFRLVPCMIAAVNEVDPEASRFVYWYEPSSFPVPRDAARLLDEHGGQNPLVRHTLATGDGSAWRISDLCSAEEFHATPLYRELYHPMGMEYQMSVTLPAPTPLVFALVLGNGERDFSDRDRLIMNALRPHLAYAWRNIRDQDRLRGQEDGLGSQRECLERIGATTDPTIKEDWDLSSDGVDDIRQGVEGGDGAIHLSASVVRHHDGIGTVVEGGPGVIRMSKSFDSDW